MVILSGADKTCVEKTCPTDEVMDEYCICYKSNHTTVADSETTVGKFGANIELYESFSA